MNDRSICTWGITIAEAVSLRSTCPKRKVGCILLDKDNIILAAGYNGTPRGFPNCKDENHCPFQSPKEDCCLAIHAEINALMHCADIKKVHTVICTCFPCYRCLKALLNTSMEVLIFRDTYPEYTSHLKLLTFKNISILRV